MSIFKTKAIILKIKKQSENKNLYFVFSREYGKIMCYKKENSKEKNLDIGYNISCEIEVSQNSDFHKIRNVKILNQFDYNEKDFKVITGYLELISLVEKNMQSGMVHEKIYSLLDAINSRNVMTSEKIILAKLKLKNLIGELSGENEEGNIKKIINFIEKYDISQVLKLTGLTIDDQKKLENLI